MTRVGVALVAVILAAAMTAEAQDMEPRAYSNAPVGLNFLILGYGYTQGEVALDTSAPIEDGKITVHNAVLGYAHALGLWGRAAKLDVALPYAWLSGSAKVAGKPVDREVSGLGDPRARFSFLFYGAPALSMEDFREYEPDLILGASLAVTVPLGQYDSDKLVNIGTNRWSFKPEIGISKTWGPV
ncbi:MAG TPA: transporter, partial [Candidatus Binatia bacterium]|nr:transporter [Candidatus Binatia bacterium]